MQFSQRSQPLCTSTATRSPTANSSTPGPRAATVPAYSWPMTKSPSGWPASLRLSTLRSVPQMEATVTRSSTSPGPGSGTARASTRRSPAPWSTAAVIFEGMDIARTPPGPDGDASAADGGADAPAVLVDVADQDPGDDLLDAHRRHPRQDGALLGQLGVAERRGEARRGRRVLLVQDKGLRLRAAGVLLRVLGVHSVEHVHREMRHRLPGGHGPDDTADALVAHGDVVRHDADRPLLRRRDLFPVGIAQFLEDGRREIER